MKNDTSHIAEKELDDKSHVYSGVCPQCHYLTAWLVSEMAASDLLNRHRRTRAHKTNTASEHRYAL